jgi:hypothetical protein
MAGRIGSIQKAQDGQTYGFVIFDAQCSNQITSTLRWSRFPVVGWTGSDSGSRRCRVSADQRAHNLGAGLLRLSPTKSLRPRDQAHQRTRR